MRRAVVAALLVVLFSYSYSGISQETFNNISSRLLEMKSDLKVDLHKKNYGNEVVGTFELKGDKIKLSSFMLPVKGRKNQKNYNITEERDLNSFKLLSSNQLLPKYSYGKEKNMLLKDIAKTTGKGLAVLLGLLFGMKMFFSKKKKKRKSRKTEEKKSKKAA
ncbi:hypothetical protein [Haliovirga abyssi]|uniref:Uncharacterized protein n=1 Tax=Haliovirga abyssi TaxID=2996794 RepID=A0AAU9DJ38_9FUSO|nr:hypothetical protein [Haliovirga abyssi]BDU49857.1 hypothetical protein HLVA_04260 [Haliovirga abyssi]